MIEIYNIPLLLTTILISCVLVYCYRYFSGLDKKIGLFEWLIIIIFSIFIMLNNYTKSIITESIFNFVLYLSIFYLIFRENLLKTFHLSLYICVLILFIDLLFSILLEFHFVDFKLVILSEKVFYSIIISFSFYFIYHLSLVKKLYIILMTFIENKKNHLLILYLIFGLLLILYNIYITIKVRMDIYILIILVFIFIYIISSLYFKENYRNNLLRVKNSKLIENQIIYKKCIEDYRIFRHNLLNDFLFIKTLCSNEAQEIINEKIAKYTALPDKLHNINKIPEGLQGIIYLKADVAKNYNINFYLDNLSAFDRKQLKSKTYIDLCDIMAIVLDNAIEASAKTEEKVVYINIIDDNKDISIEVINTFSNDINLEEIGNFNYSTKKRNSGLGLHYIINLNKKIKIKKEIINNLFKISITFNRNI